MSHPTLLARRLVSAVLIAVALVGFTLAVSACGDDGAPTTDETSGEFDAYVGLDVEEATARAKADGRPSRVVRIDGEDLAVTMDFVEDRLNFEVQDGRITAVTTG